MKDKIVIITGANRGIGKAATKEIAKLGAKYIWLAARLIRPRKSSKKNLLKQKMKTSS